MKTIIKFLSLVLILALILPVQAVEQTTYHQIAEALAQEPESSGQGSPRATAGKIRQPSKEEIAAKWATVTSASTIYASTPSVRAPYVAGSLTEDFLTSGLTYLNYVRFVAGLPEVTLDDTLNMDAQHGAVVLAAVDTLTHTPSRPANMDYAFYKRGYDATSSSNISARWGYWDLTTMLKSSVEGCMNDNNSLNNLSCVGHRRWLLNPALGKVGFGYAESATDWSYIATKVFDRTGPGCEFDFISWPVAGNHPTNLFEKQNPWSVTLNTNVFKTASAKYVKITVTRQSDGKQWTFDKNTGSPNIGSNGRIQPYMTVENSWYGLPNCIIFHPGSGAVNSYEGVYNVKITGINYTNGAPAELNYEVDFFDINDFEPDVCSHKYDSVVTAPTCTKDGYTTYTCSKCGTSYVDDYVNQLGHNYSYKVTKVPTESATGTLTGTCSRCSGTTTVSLPKLNTTDYSYSVIKAAACTANGTGRYTWKTTDYGNIYFDVTIGKTGHSYASMITEPTCEKQGYTTYTCGKCGNSYVDNYTGTVDHSYENGHCKWCGKDEQFAKWYSGTTSLNGAIDLNIYVLLSDDLVNADDTYVRFTYAGKTVDVPMDDALYSPLDTAPNRYRFSTQVYAKQLADSVNVKFMKGNEMIGEELNYSVVQYCENQIKKCKVPEEVALYKAMLNYGAASQQLFNYNTSNLANKSLSDADKVLANVNASAFKHDVSGSEAGIKAKSATLMLEDVVKVRVYFTLTGNKSIDQYTFTIDGKKVTPQYNDKGWYVETDGIAAKDLEKMFQVKVGGITVKYGALSYVNSKVGGSNALEANISKALFAYWKAAEALLG